MSKNTIIIAVDIENEMNDQFELNIQGVTVFVSREQLHDAIALAVDPSENYDIGINTEAMFEDLGGEEF